MDAPRPVTRRHAAAAAALLAGLMPYALLQRALAREAFATPVAPIAARWLRRVQSHARATRDGRLSQAAWQAHMAELFARAPLPDLLALIDFDRFVRSMSLPDDRADARDPPLPPVAGLPPARAFVTRVFGLARGRAIVPHGHANVASGHLVVRGELRVRHYDRVRDEPDALVLRPTIDRVSRPGAATTVSDARDNVHWLVARSAAAYTLDVIVAGVDPARETRATDFVDPLAATPLPGGLLRAPRLSAAEVFRRYGRGGVGA